MIILRRLAIARDFDAIVCGDQVSFRKPHPLILNTIMRRLRCAPQETVYVGDMNIDVKPAGGRACARWR